MDDLRLILLLIGAGIILVVYAWTHIHHQSRQRKDPRGPGAAGQRPDEPDDADIEQELARMERLVMRPDEAEPEKKDSDRLLVVSVVAPAGTSFSGEALSKGFRTNELQFSEQGFYQRLADQGGKQQAVFGVANMVKPGTFAAGDMIGFSTPGVTLFLQLPGPVDGLQAFDDFVNTAERLAVELGGQLQDQQHRLLTHQALMQIRETIAEARLHPQLAS